MSRAASRRQHKHFCEIEGWAEVTNARGTPLRHHLTYELALADGRILRTRISRPANNDTYGPSLWAAILRDQLDVTEDEFWACVTDSAKPARPGRPAHPPPQALPASLVHQLLHTLHLSDQQVAALTKEEAVALMSEYWSRPTQAE